MQPNQQDPANTNQPVQPTEPVRLDPYGRPLLPEMTQPMQQGIPEYLHMELGVTPPRQSNSKKGRILIVLIILLVITVTGYLAYLYAQQNTAQEKFYRAVDKLMQTKYVTRNYSLKDSSSSNGVITIKSNSDLTDPSMPKSKLTYSNKDANNVTIKGEIVTLDSQLFYARLTEAPASIALNNLTTNIWYAIDKNVSSRQRTMLDSLRLRTVINSPLSFVVTGNFSNETRQQYLDSMKSNNIYVVQSSRADQLNGKQTTAYTVEFDSQKMTALNKKLAETMKVDNPTVTLEVANIKKMMTFWVDDNTSEVKKVKLSTNYTPGDLGLDAEITMDYPTSASIGIPSNATKDITK